MREKHWEQKLIVHEQRERDHELQVRIFNTAPNSSVVSPQVEAWTFLIAVEFFYWQEADIQRIWSSLFFLSVESSIQKFLGQGLEWRLEILHLN